MDTIKSSTTRLSKRWPKGTSAAVIALHKKMMQGISLYKQIYGNDIIEREMRMTQREYDEHIHNNRRSLSGNELEGAGRTTSIYASSTQRNN